MVGHGQTKRTDFERFFADRRLGDVLKPPMSGIAVQNIRTALRMVGKYDVEYGNGYNEDLARAILRFQTEFNHSSRDGFVGPGTRRLLVKQVVARHGESIFERMTEPHDVDAFEYDVALSFAGEDRKHADALAASLKARDIKFFYDEYEKANLWGKNLYVHLHEVYSTRARFCVIFVSVNYARKLWTTLERQAAQERALQEKDGEYILPIRIDGTPIPGLAETIGYVNITEGIEKICDLIVEKIAKAK